MIRVFSSFRDPSGYVFEENGVMYRTITESYRTHYEALMGTSLYNELTKQRLLVPHEELSNARPDCWRMIAPQKIEFISYPFEWSFSQWKDAALLTLNIMERALKRDMCLKDASAFNIQWYKGKPIFIDTLSFEIREKNGPWAAYGQFCRHFLAPLLLMAYCDIRLQHLFLHYLDGIPLDLASKLLPLRTRLKPGILLHIHIHAGLVTKFGSGMSGGQRSKAPGNRDSVPALIDSLTHLIQGIKPPLPKTEWAAYYLNTNYSAAAFESKKSIAERFIEQIHPKRVCDLGANDGTFSRIAAKYAKAVISADIDPIAVENNYKQLAKDTSIDIWPVLLDLNNPTSQLGWANQEWRSFDERCRSDLVMALGLIHHLCISNNLPLSFVAAYLARLAEYAIVEFVPKSDSNAQRLLSIRTDIFPNYTQEGFESEFGEIYDIVLREQVKDSPRVIYLLKKR